jgi:hypothetical protein
MKKSILALLVIAPLSLGLSGCVFKIGGDGEFVSTSDFEDREYKNRKQIAKISLGAGFNDTQMTMGVADFTETYKNKEQVVQVLYYRTHRIRKDGLTTKDECTYMNFIDGVLTQTGNGADYQRLVNVSLNVN